MPEKFRLALQAKSERREDPMGRTADAKERILDLFEWNGWDYYPVSRYELRFIVRTTFCLESFRTIFCAAGFSPGRLILTASADVRCRNYYHELEILRFVNFVNRKNRIGTLTYDGDSGLFLHTLTVPYLLLEEMNAKELERCILFPAELLHSCAESTVMIEGGSSPRIEAYFSMERRSG